MADHWFRLYDKIVHDIKVQALPGPLFKTWINILCIVSDNGGCLPGLNAIAFALRVDEATALVALTALRKAGLLDTGEGGAIVPHNWKARQFIKDGEEATEGSGTKDAIKSKKQREKKKAKFAEAEAEAARLRGEVSTPVSTPVATPTRQSGDTGGATPPDTEQIQSRSDTDQKQRKEGSREVALVPSGWPANAFDQFWAKYPNKVDRAGSMKSLARAAKNGIEWSTIMTGLDRYIAKTDDRPWCNPTTWINQARWDEQRTEVTPHGKTGKTGGSIIDALREQAEFFDRQAVAERTEIDDYEAGGADVLRLPDQ